VAQPTDVERDLQRLEAELKRLEAEYNMFFAGRLPKPPWETRNRVDTLVKKYDRAYIQNYGDRFRFSTLQSRYMTFVDLWDRGQRAREEGRPGPFTLPRSDPSPAAHHEEKVVCVASFTDPLHEMDKLRDLYDSLSDARRELGREAVPFHKFAELVRAEVQKLQTNSKSEVAFRVALKDGKIRFTARALKGTSGRG